MRTVEPARKQLHLAQQATQSPIWVPQQKVLQRLSEITLTTTHSGLNLRITRKPELGLDQSYGVKFDPQRCQIYGQKDRIVPSSGKNILRMVFIKCIKCLRTYNKKHKLETFLTDLLFHCLFYLTKKRLVFKQNIYISNCGTFRDQKS